MASRNNVRRATLKCGRSTSSERINSIFSERQIESYLLAKDTIRRIQRMSCFGLPSRTIALQERRGTPARDQRRPHGRPDAASLG